jgi:FAD/FMN-containing dehydrogenase
MQFTAGFIVLTGTLGATMVSSKQSHFKLGFLLLAELFKDSSKSGFEFKETLQNGFKEHYPEFEVFIFGHIGDGNLHIFIRKPLQMSSDEFHKRCLSSDLMLYRITQSFKGSISAEHGIGLYKKPGLSYSHSPEELRYLRGLKKLFDPKGILNPDKILTLE